jgi:acyl-coenzyme A synthetase/AMP-(fatty) acid ligase
VVVHPGDVERVLLTHPAVADAGVAAASQAGTEQVAKAFVVVAPGAETTEQELLAWCRDHLAAPQIPAFVTFVNRLPRNSVGKLVRAQLPNAATLMPTGRGR